MQALRNGLSRLRPSKRRRAAEAQRKAKQEAAEDDVEESEDEVKPAATVTAAPLPKRPAEKRHKSSDSPARRNRTLREAGAIKQVSKQERRRREEEAEQDNDVEKYGTADEIKKYGAKNKQVDDAQSNYIITFTSNNLADYHISKATGFIDKSNPKTQKKHKDYSFLFLNNKTFLNPSCRYQCPKTPNNVKKCTTAFQQYIDWRHKLQEDDKYGFLKWPPPQTGGDFLTDGNWKSEYDDWLQSDNSKYVIKTISYGPEKYNITKKTGGPGLFLKQKITDRSSVKENNSCEQKHEKCYGACESECPYCSCQSCYQLHLSRYYLQEEDDGGKQSRFGSVRQGVDNSYMIDLRNATSPILKKTTVRKKRPHHSLNNKIIGIGPIFYKRREIAKPRWERITVKSADNRHKSITKWNLIKKRMKKNGKGECDTTHVCKKNCSKKHNEYHMLSNIIPPSPPSPETLIKTAMNDLVSRERSSTDPFTNQTHFTDRSIALNETTDKPLQIGWKKVNTIKQ